MIIRFKKVILGVFCGLILISCKESDQKSSGNEDTTASDVYAGNPVVKDLFTADPAALVHDNKLYLFTGHDEQEEGKERRKY